MSGVTINGTTVRATAYDTLFTCSTGTGACGLVLPAVTVVADGWTVRVVDSGNNAAVNLITVSTPDGSLINGQTSLVISTSGAAAELVKFGNTWAASGEFTPTSTSSANVVPYFSVQSVAATTGTILPGTSMCLVNFAGTVALTLPATNAAGVVYGRQLTIQNIQNTGNTSSQAIWLVAGNVSCSVNGTNTTATISTSLGGLRLVPTSTGWWQF